MKNKNVLNDVENINGEIVGFDKNGNPIYKNYFGIETYFEYDTNGNCIHIKTGKLWNKFEIWKDYDEYGHCIHYKTSKGLECWYEYDENGNRIYYKCSTGYEEHKSYDKYGNCVYYKDNTGCEKWFEFDDQGRCIKCKESTGHEEENKFDDTGRIIYKKCLSGVEIYWEYEDNVMSINVNPIRKVFDRNTFRQYEKDNNCMIERYYDGHLVSIEEYNNLGEQVYYTNYSSHNIVITSTIK